MKALILAGGRGKRFREVSNDKNKCIIDINGRPLIEYSLNCATQTVITEVVIVVGHKAEDIINTYGNRYNGKPIRIKANAREASRCLLSVL